MEPTAPRPGLLVFLKGGIGDVVFALPLLADLRRGYPGHALTVLTHAQGADVVRLAPAVDRVIAYGPLQARPRATALRAALLTARCEVAVTPVRSVRAAWLLVRSGARVRVGFGGGPEALLLTHRAPVHPWEVVFARRFERLALALGLEARGMPTPLAVPEALTRAAAARLRAAGWDGISALLAVHVGGGWTTKQWPTEHVAAFAQLVSRRYGAQVVLLGGEEDRPRARAVLEAVDGAAIAEVGTSVAETLAALALCTAAVGIDSGISHAGVALGVPTVSLFGPNDPASVLLARHQRLIVQELACRPCNRAAKAGCPLGHHRCMRDTRAEQVLAALEPLLPAGEARLRSGQGSG